MPRTPNARITNRDDATVDPTVNDDESVGYDIGSRWINTAANRVFFATDVTAGAAVWKDVSTPGAGSHPVTIQAVNPTVNDDSNAGFAIGDHWIDSSTQQIFQATDVSVGAAVWERVDGPKHNTASADPTASNDNTEGYEVGSFWINTDTKKSFVCLSVATGAAVWLETTNVPGTGRQTPKETFLGGNLLTYGGVGSAASSEIQYSRVWLTAGITYVSARVFVNSGGAPNRHIRLGIYDQTNPNDVNGVPNTKLAETAETATTAGLYITPPFTSPLSITVTGYYWIAFVVDTPAVKFAITPAVFRENFLPIRRQATTGTTLPATAGTLSNPASAVVYASVVEQ